MIHAPAEWMEIVRKHLRFYLTQEYQVILFGSRATGVRLKKHSDFDLCIKGKSKIDSHLLSSLKEGFVNSDLPVRVDVADWHELPDFLKKIVDEEGVEVSF